MIRKSLINTGLRIGPLSRLNKSFTTMCKTKKLKITTNANHINVQKITQYKLGCFQNRYYFCSYKLTELTAKIKKLEDQSTEIQAKLHEAGIERSHTQEKIKQKIEKITQMKNQTQFSTASPEHTKDLESRQEQLSLFKSKLESTEKLIEGLKKQRGQLQKEVEKLKPKQAKQNSQDQSAEIQAKLLEAGIERSHTQQKTKQETETVTSQLKSQIKTIPANIEHTKELQSKEGEFNAFKSKLEQKQKIFNKFEYSKQLHKKKENLLLQKKKKQNYQQKNSWYSNWSKIQRIIKQFGGYAGVFSLIMIAYQTYYGRWNLQDTTSGRRAQALKDYSTNSYDKELEKFIQGSPIYNQIKQLLQNSKTNKILFIAGNSLVILGCPGVGKTTSVKHLIRNYRKDNKFFYYINLSQVNKTPQEKVSILTNLLDGIKQKHSQTKEKKSIKLIIDDINILEKRMSLISLVNIMDNLKSFLNQQYLQIVCISSSSSFISRVSSSSIFSNVQKGSQFVVLQDLSSSQYKQFTKKLIVQYKIDASEKIQDYIINNKYSARDIIDFKNQFEGQKNETLQLLKQKDEQKSEVLSNFCGKILTKKEYPKLEQFILKQLINSPQKLSITNCSRIYKKIENTLGSFNKLINFEEVIDQFEERNDLIFCRPRSEIHKNGFKRALNSLIEGKEYVEQQK